MPPTAPRRQRKWGAPRAERGWKSETRGPKPERNPKPRNPKAPLRQQTGKPSAPPYFGFRVSAFLRVSGFGFRISLPLARLML
jgi:hypothetical protein